MVVDQVMKVVLQQLFREKKLVPFHFGSVLFQTKPVFFWLQKKPTDKDMQVQVAEVWPDSTEMYPKGYMQGI